jgi:UDP-N-acetylmuramate dehydrogenase
MTKSIDDFSNILQRDQSLAPYTWLRLGGPVEYLLTPGTEDELLEVVRYCLSAEIPIRILGGGSNLLVADEGVSGAVIRITDSLLNNVEVKDDRLIAGGGTQLSHAVSESVRAQLAGLEVLVGVPGTVGGAVVGNAGGRHGDIGELIESVSVVDRDGNIAERSGDELSFSYRRSSLDDVLVLSATFQLKADPSDELTRRMRKNWIMKRATQPLADQSAGCIFRNPRGLSAGALIEQCGLKGMTSGQARISDRHANFIVTDEATTSQDVDQLISRIQSAVAEKFGVDLDLEICRWS